MANEERSQDSHTTTAQHIVRGIPASPGIVIGKAFVLHEEEVCYVRRTIRKNQLPQEIQRFRQALTKARQEMEASRGHLLRLLGKSHARLVDVYLLVLEDPLLTKDVEKRIAHDMVNAETAVWQTVEQVNRAFEEIPDEYYRERRFDIVDVGKKLLHHLSGTERRTLADLHEEAIVVTHNLMPSDTFSMPEQFVQGLGTDIGGRTSHTAILAQSLDIPAVVGLKDLTGRVNTGDPLILDGNEGLVIIHPDRYTLENYRREQTIQREEGRALEKLRDLPAQTRDGHRVQLSANIEIPDEVKGVLNHGAEGVGLYRTEFLYLNRDTLPTEEEHYQAYRQVVQSVLPYAVVLRTVDIGGDKLAQFQLGRHADEANPFLGLRGIRLCLRYPEVFKTQLAGILRAGTEGKLKVMYPMVSSVDELRQANAILQDVTTELRKRGTPCAEPVEVGVMIEVPSAALIADLLAQEVDFLSIGTNDLIQYTLAVDRVNENVASLYDPLHLGILRLLRSVIEAGHRAGKWVGMCGEMAGDPVFTPILVGLGLDEFSVPPAAVPRIKQAVRALNRSEAEALARDILSLPDHETMIKRLLRSRSAL